MSRETTLAAFATLHSARWQREEAEEGVSGDVKGDRYIFA